MLCQKTAILFVFLSATISYVSACERWIEEPVECKPVLQVYSAYKNNYFLNGTSINTQNSSTINIYVPPGYTQQQLVTAAKQRVSQVYPIVPKACRSTLIEYICLEAFRRCVSVEYYNPVTKTTGIVETPSISCRGVCNDAQASCSPFFISNNQTTPIPNCETHSDMMTGMKGYPISNYTNGNITIPCTNGDDIHVPNYVTKGDIDCGRLIFDAEADPPCVQTCVLPVLTAQEWNVAVVLCTVLSATSWGLTLLMITFFLVRKKYWKFPKVMHLFIAIASNLASFGMLIGFLYNHAHGPNAAWCEDDKTPRGFNGICAAQGAIIHWASTATTLWWLCIGMYLFVTINILPSYIVAWVKPLLPPFFYFLCFGIPTLLTVITLAMKKYKFFGTSPFCFVDYGASDGLFFIPVFVMIGIGTIFLGASTIKIIVVTYQLKSNVYGVTQPRLPRETWRILFFLIILLYVYALVLASKYNFWPKRKEMEANFTEYFTCFLTEQFQPTGRTCKLNRILDINLLYASTFNSGVQGVLVFLFCGLTPNNCHVIWKILTGRSFRFTSTEDNSYTGKKRSSATKPSSLGSDSLDLEEIREDLPANTDVTDTIDLKGVNNTSSIDSLVVEDDTRLP